MAGGRRGNAGTLKAVGGLGGGGSADGGSINGYGPAEGLPAANSTVETG